MCQWVVAEDAPEMARLLDAKMHSVEQIMEEEQAHRVQVAALLQMQFQAMERMEEQERELRRLSNLMAWLRGEVQEVLPGTVNTVRGAAERVGQVSDVGNLPALRGDTLEDILAEDQEEEVPVTPQRWIQFATSTPIVRPVE